MSGSSKSSSTVSGTCILLAFHGPIGTGAPPFSNQTMLFYHGTVVDSEFTPIFYMTELWVITYFGRQEVDSDWFALLDWANPLLGRGRQTHTTVQEALDAFLVTPSNSPEFPDVITDLFGPLILGNPCATQ